MALPNKTPAQCIYKTNTKGPWSVTRGPRIGGPGPWACGLTVWIGPSNPCRWPMTRVELSCANLAQATPKAGRRCVLYGPWTVALGPRSTGLGKMVQYPRDKFYVAKWGVFCHSAWLQISPARFKQVYSDKAIVIHHCQSDDFR